MGQLGVFAVLFFFTNENTYQETDGATIDSTLSLMIALFCMMSIGMSFFMYAKRKENGRQLEGTLDEKFAHYQQCFIIRAAMLEGPNLAVLMFYFFFERNYFYLLLFAIGMNAFMLIRPTIDRIVEDYQLSTDEQRELRTTLD